VFEELSAGGDPPGTRSPRADPVLAAIAAKGVNELAYHRDYAAQWVIRLGDGTELSHQRMQRGLDAVWPLYGELFRPDPGALAAVSQAAVDAVLAAVLAAAGLDWPSAAPLAAVGGRAGRDGVHTEAMGCLLAELQSVARADPDATW
jgi:ring-1,2-phenylacetyl-CoA epoxidase subunit PaaC